MGIVLIGGALFTLSALEKDKELEQLRQAVKAKESEEEQV